MPRLLRQRIRDDTVRKFEDAAQDRYRSGSTLLQSGLTLSAVYLLGYSVEIRLKAAYFRNMGFSADDIISPVDRNNALSQYGRLGRPQKPGPHDVLYWAELLVATRDGMGDPYEPSISEQVVAFSQDVFLRWSELLRYRANRPYRHEVTSVLGAAGWFEDYYPSL